MSEEKEAEERRCNDEYWLATSERGGGGGGGGEHRPAMPTARRPIINPSDATDNGRSSQQEPLPFQIQGLGQRTIRFLGRLKDTAVGYFGSPAALGPVAGRSPSRRMKPYQIRQRVPLRLRL